MKKICNKLLFVLVFLTHTLFAEDIEIVDPITIPGPTPKPFCLNIPEHISIQNSLIKSKTRDCYEQAPCTYYGQIGTESYAGLYPYGYAFSEPSRRTQFLIYKSELDSLGIQAGDYISAIYLNIFGTFPANTLTSFKIALGHTALNDIVPTAPTGVTGLSAFHTSSPFLFTTGGWRLHTGIPFEWDGVSNIVIQTCAQGPTGAFMLGAPAVFSSIIPVLSLYGLDASPTIDCASIPFTYGIAVRPNIVLKVEGQCDPFTTGDVFDPVPTTIQMLKIVRRLGNTYWGVKSDNTLHFFDGHEWVQVTASGIADFISITALCDGSKTYALDTSGKAYELTIVTINNIGLPATTTVSTTWVALTPLGDDPTLEDLFFAIDQTLYGKAGRILYSHTSTAGWKRRRALAQTRYANGARFVQRKNEFIQIPAPINTPS